MSNSKGYAENINMLLFICFCCCCHVPELCSILSASFSQYCNEPFYLLFIKHCRSEAGLLCNVQKSKVKTKASRTKNKQTNKRLGLYITHTGTDNNNKQHYSLKIVIYLFVGLSSFFGASVVKAL